MHLKFYITLACTLLCFLSLPAQEKEYPDGHGKKVKLPLGDLSFADSLISYTPGTPSPIPQNAEGWLALGTPNFNPDSASGFVSLGTGGTIILKFTNNALVNINGPDLYVFEMGKYVEETFLYVSKDAKNWISVGKIGGGNALIEIGDSTKPGEIFNYVKLVDAKTYTKKGDNMWPGADIDAVAAIGSAIQYSLSAQYLFNTNEATLKNEAKSELEKIVTELNKMSNVQLVINGHTDSLGTRIKNEELSFNRAVSVKKYLEKKLNNKSIGISCSGYADTFPVAPNSTESGRQKNRRVEIYILPYMINDKTKP